MGGLQESVEILVVGDSDEDAELLLRALRRSGVEARAHRVHTASSLKAALADPWDIVIVDHSMSQFDVRDVLLAVRAVSADLPFIVVSDSAGEEAVVELMRAGVNDCVLKESLIRLGPVVAREVLRAGVERRRAELGGEQVIARDDRHFAASMLEKERMAAIGILAAGIGHEINNPLAYILANLEFISTEVEVLTGELSQEARRRLEPRLVDLDQALADTSQGAERIRTIIADLRTFSRNDETRTLVDVRQVLDAAVRMAAVQIRQRATVVKNYADDVSPVLASGARLGQVFLNLVINAVQSLPVGGEPSRSRVELDVHDEGEFVHVEVADTGCGIAADVLPRIFEPFFTTKAADQAAGLGLGICQRIVTQLCGEIRVSSEIDVGTRFVVRIPHAA